MNLTLKQWWKTKIASQSHESLSEQTEKVVTFLIAHSSTKLWTQQLQNVKYS